MAASALLMAGILGLPALRETFHLTVLTGSQWLIAAGLALLSIVQVELFKLAGRLTGRGRVR